jgi:hypothetical protein
MSAWADLPGDLAAAAEGWGDVFDPADLAERRPRPVPCRKRPYLPADATAGEQLAAAASDAWAVASPEGRRVVLWCSAGLALAASIALVIATRRAVRRLAQLAARELPRAEAAPAPEVGEQLAPWRLHWVR